MKNVKEFRNIKTRVEHTCCGCNSIIKKGSVAQFMSFKEPRYENEIQVGIIFVKLYLHLDELECWNDLKIK